MLSSIQRRLAKLEQRSKQIDVANAAVNSFSSWALEEIEAGKLDADFVDVLAAIKGWSFRKL